MGTKDHGGHELPGVGSRCGRHRARSWLSTLLSVSVLAACAPARLRPAPTAAGAPLDAPAIRHRPFREVPLGTERERLLRQRAQERLRLELHIRDHDGRFVRDAG